MTSLAGQISERRLSDDQVRAFHRDGWVKAAGFFTPAEVADMDRWTNELLSRPETPGEHMVYYEQSYRAPAERIVQRIEYFCGYHPEFDRLVNGELKAAVARLFGDPPILFNEKVNFNLPGAPGFE